MLLTNQEIEHLIVEGVWALQNGQVRESRQRFERVTKTGRADARVWLLLATACRADNDAVAEEAALDNVLAIEPWAVRAHIMKADCRAKAGDEIGAARFYRSGLLRAEGQQWPSDLQDEIRRAENALAEIDHRVEAKKEALLVACGLPPEKRSPRFQQALDISAGRKDIFVQQPSVFYFPQLPQIQFYDRADFEWVHAVEAAADAIREELLDLLRQGTEGFRPYIQGNPNQPRRDTIMAGLTDNRDWSALFLCENGKVSEDLVARCPRTWEAVRQAPLAMVSDWGPTVMFSLLRAGARIPPHTGMLNTRLTCHLPLVLPPKCAFRVGNEVREWEEGRLLIFDDTIEHEAWNGSSEDRVILIFDIWRPELSDRELGELDVLFGQCGATASTIRESGVDILGQAS